MIALGLLVSLWRAVPAPAHTPLPAPAQAQDTAPAPQVRDSARGPTVGDTLWLTRTVLLSPRQTVHPGAWQPPDPIEAVGPPRVTVHGTTVELAYPVAVWRAGEHRIEIPGPLVLGPGSRVDSLPPYDTTITIQSVLPAAPPNTIAPQPPAGFVPRRLTSWWPLAVFWALAVVLLVPLHWWWRRRGKPVPVVPPVAASADLPVERWAAAGEHRTVVALGAARLRAALETAPHRGGAEDDALLAMLDRARFRAQTEDDALALYRRATEAAMRFGGPAS